MILLAGEHPVVECVAIDEGCLLEGDIALQPSQFVEQIDVDENLATEESALLSSPGTWWKWPDGVVPYTISSGLPWSIRQKVTQAIAHWEARTPVRFVPRSGHADFVTFRYSSAGYAYANLGRRGGQQFVNLVEANPVGVVIHEIGHTLGFYHEHTRPDRDNHVTIHWGNIRSGFEGNFYRYDSGSTVGPYDIDSVMHYPSYEFSRNGYATITRKNGTAYPANYSGLSAGDIAAVTTTYGGGSSGGGWITIDSNNGNNDTSRGYIQVSGNWVSSANVAGFYGTGYWYAPRASISDAASFWFYLAQPARRSVYARWSAATDRAPDAPFIIWDPTRRELGRAIVNQRTNGGQWNKLGTYDFPRGWNRVLLSRWTVSSNTVVIADAVQIR